MAALRSAEDILVTGLREIYSAEKQLSRAIPKFSKMASSDRLREMLDHRREQGAELMEELDSIFERMEVRKSRLKNTAAEGLLEDATEHVEEVDDERLLDPVLLASVQKLEHYCIASWGTAAAMARLLGQKAVTKTMERVLSEGKRFDQELTDLAEEEINPMMLAGDEEEEEVEEAPRGNGRRSRARKTAGRKRSR